MSFDTTSLVTLMITPELRDDHTALGAFVSERLGAHGSRAVLVMVIPQDVPPEQQVDAK